MEQTYDSRMIRGVVAVWASLILTLAGVASVGVYNSFFSGRNAYYLERVVEAGFVGLHSASAAPHVLPPGGTRPALGTGFIGAFTTFSSLATATDHLLAHGHPMLAIAYMVGSLFGGLVAALLGLAGGRATLALAIGRR